MVQKLPGSSLANGQIRQQFAVFIDSNNCMKTNNDITKGEKVWASTLFICDPLEIGQ